MRGEVDRQIKELLCEGVIRPSNSPYYSPICVVPKKRKPNGEKQYRMVIDFKGLNAVTISDTYPIPDINSTLTSLSREKYFTTLDLTSGFHQILMKESYIPKTAEGIKADSKKVDAINATEENYATIEKEMLAIIWAIDNHRSYLYGSGTIKVYIDHQPLTYALGNRNFNAKLKHWKDRIEEYNCLLIYKPGK